MILIGCAWFHKYDSHAYWLANISTCNGSAHCTFVSNQGPLELYLYFNYLVSITAGGPLSPRGHMQPSSTVDFGWFVAFWEHQKFKIDWNCNFGFSMFWYFRVNVFNFGNIFVWRRITDEGSLPEMRIWSMLLDKPDLKWCIHLSRSLFLYFNYLVSVTAVGQVRSRGHM